MHYVKNIHSFHIPVMGIGFTIDTPVRVAPYGITSVISLVDDILMEKMREFYCDKLQEPFQAISNKIDDFRAKRITAYLDLVDEMVTEAFNELKNSVMEKGSELERYVSLLPDSSSLKEKFNHFLQNNHLAEAIQWLKSNMQVGNIDVNIMTKVDRDNFKGKEKLPVMYNDAHAAIRGYANSTLESSLVLSAGMNPRLYSFMENFEDFFPDEKGFIKKRITLKVSDYRSAVIQAKFLAKKGIWVSEYRVESGLNCGGHAFATQGHLMFPILEEFKEKRSQLTEETYAILKIALQSKNRVIPTSPPPVTITAQGGVGTHREHQFLLEYYELDSVGWGTPFLLVPEVSNVDKNTLELLSEATEKDLYVSGISPLGIPFNSLKKNTKDIEKQAFIDNGKPGVPCTKQVARLNYEFSEKGICTASREYQSKKIKELKEKNLDPETYQAEFRKITEKACICVGLGTAALLINGIETKSEGEGVSVCPGPNMAYFSKVVSLQEMVDHIYGRADVMVRRDRPHMMIKELEMYIDYYQQKISESTSGDTNIQKEYLLTFQKNLQDGINYYKVLLAKESRWFAEDFTTIMDSISRLEEKLSYSLSSLTA